MGFAALTLAVFLTPAADGGIPQPVDPGVAAPSTWVDPASANAVPTGRRRHVRGDLVPVAFSSTTPTVAPPDLRDPFDLRRTLVPHGNHRRVDGDLRDPFAGHHVAAEVPASNDLRDPFAPVRSRCASVMDGVPVQRPSSMRRCPQRPSAPPPLLEPFGP